MHSITINGSGGSFMAELLHDGKSIDCQGIESDYLEHAEAQACRIWPEAEFCNGINLNDHNYNQLMQGGGLTE